MKTSYGFTKQVPEVTVSEEMQNPKHLPRHCVSVLVSANKCANCLGELDTGWECNSCGFDWKPWMEASTAQNNAAFDRREA